MVKVDLMTPESAGSKNIILSMQRYNKTKSFLLLVTIITTKMIIIKYIMQFNSRSQMLIITKLIKMKTKILLRMKMEKASNMTEISTMIMSECSLCANKGRRSCSREKHNPHSREISLNLCFTITIATITMYSQSQS